MAIYWTNAWSDSGFGMREDCAMTRRDTAEKARAAAVADMATMTDLEDNEQIVVGPMGEIDCWAKVPASWTMDEIAEYAAEKGIDPADISVRRPGRHPAARIRPG